MSPNWRYAYDRPAPGALARPTVLRPRDLLRFLGGFGAVNAVADLASFAVLALALHGPDALDDRAVFHSAWFTENLLTQAVVMVLLRGGGGGGPGHGSRRAGGGVRSRPWASCCRCLRSVRRWGWSGAAGSVLRGCGGRAGAVRGVPSPSLGGGGVPVSRR